MLGAVRHAEPLSAFGQRRRPEGHLFRLADEKLRRHRELRGSYAKFRCFLEQQFGFNVLLHAEFLTQQFVCRQRTGKSA